VKPFPNLPLILAALAIHSASSPTRAGVMLEFAGFRWDSDHAGVITGSTVIPPSRPVSGFLADNPDFNPGLNGTTTGRQLGGSGPAARAASLGESGNRESFTYSFPFPIADENPGDDFVVFEQGTTGQPEAFMVRALTSGGTLSDWRYEFFNAEQAFPVGFIGVGFSTGFDLIDFGFLAGTLVVQLEIANLLPTDRVSEANGEGFVRFVGDPLYGSSFTPINPATGTAFAPGDFDPDIIYATALAPEPSSCLMGAVGGLFALAARRRWPATLRA
jgi:hypothetical protein